MCVKSCEPVNERLTLFPLALQAREELGCAFLRADLARPTWVAIPERPNALFG
jgi:hypothetical protein